MKKMYLQQLITLCICAIGFSTHAQLTVDNKTDTNAQYSNIQDAITAANAGDTIYVHPSETSYGSIEIDKRIVLIGRTPRTKPATISSIEIKLSGSGTIIKGLRVTSSIQTTFATGLLFENNWINSISFGNPTTTNRIATIRGNYISSISSPKKTLITNNFINSSISWIEEINTTVIKNNIFRSTSPIRNSDNTNGKKALIQNCIFITSSTSPRILELDNLNLTNCLLFNYGGATYEINDNCTNCSTTDILENTNPMFTTFNNSDFVAITNDFTLQNGSPAKAAGTNQEEIGIMGNGFSYRSTLHPYGFPTVQILTNTAQVPENGTIKVTFTGKSN